MFMFPRIRVSRVSHFSCNPMLLHSIQPTLYGYTVCWLWKKEESPNLVLFFPPQPNKAEALFRLVCNQPVLLLLPFPGRSL